ncbi:hypothetical protein AB2B41_06815 [Marimonas sp. MJW-29]|uniref:Uncharacterized protein n=1 Tax=Sulfitobacter sediminis TaxID=3234186 RepID=A0ABV3RL37_9RHOB
MPDDRPPGNTRNRISLCPERIPQFGGQMRSDRRLFEMINVLNRQLMQMPHRTRETSEEALQRLGFLRRD